MRSASRWLCASYSSPELQGTCLREPLRSPLGVRGGGARVRARRRRVRRHGPRGQGVRSEAAGHVIARKVMQLLGL